MATNLHGIDLAEIMQNRERIRGMKNQNKLAELKLADYETEVAGRPAKEKAKQERNTLLTGLRQKAVTGDIGAQQQLLALDPKGGADFIDAVSKMDEKQLAATKRSTDEIGKLSAYVLNGATPEEQASRYQVMLRNVDPSVAQRLPENYDRQFMEFSMAKATAMDKLLENPKLIKIGDQDVTYQRGRELERRTQPAKQANAASDSLKSADESLMYRQAAQLFGGTFDQSGNLINLDPTVRPKIQEIATIASELFKAGGVTRSQAVSQAAKQVEQNNMADNDPLGIR